jgi:GAF domain-containing protein
MQAPFPAPSKILQEIDDILSSYSSRDNVLLGVSKLLKEHVYHYDWVGFYLVDDSGSNLVLGPYVGAPTDHTKIAFGKGICGQVAVSQSSRIIQDVSQEDNYLSCSIDVQSEVVFPIMKDGLFVGELDIDSHSTAPFTEQDTRLLEAVCEKLVVLF